MSLPLRQEGMSAGKAFAFGVLSAAVEPLFGMAVVLVSGLIRPAMPWLLSFAAGSHDLCGCGGTDSRGQ